MPQYEYFCHSCQKTFTRILTLLEYDEGKITCPICGSKDVEQAVTAFFAEGKRTEVPCKRPGAWICTDPLLARIVAALP